MNLVELKRSLEVINTPEERIEYYIAYAQNLKQNNVPIIFDLEHLRRLMGLEKNDFRKIYYSIDYQYHYKYILKNRFKLKRHPLNKQKKLPTVKTLKVKLSKITYDFFSKKIYTFSNNPKVIYKHPILLQFAHDKTNLFRKLSLPSKKLKYMQRWILDNILYKLPTDDASHGFTPGKSTVSNALFHINKEFIFKTDIKDFFPAINSKRIFGLFKSFGYSKSIAYALTKICTYNDELPQGAPTSPYLSNLICRKMDYRITCLCKKGNLDYSRYADDITISGGKKIKNIKPLLQDIIESEGFKLNLEKTRFIHNSYRQTVTGIVVNKKSSIPRETYRKLRQEIYYMKKFGVSSHLDSKNLTFKSNVKAYYYGMVNYCYMIDPLKGQSLYIELNKINWKK